MRVYLQPYKIKVYHFSPGFPNPSDEEADIPEGLVRHYEEAFKRFEYARMDMDVYLRKHWSSKE